MGPRVLAAYRGSPRGAARVIGSLAGLSEYGLRGNTVESQAPPPLGAGWRKGANLRRKEVS